MADTVAGMMVCPHVLDGFKAGNVVCQVDTDNGGLNVATCRSCLLEILDGDREPWSGYTTVTKERAAALGVVIADPSSPVAPAGF